MRAITTTDFPAASWNTARIAEGGVVDVRNSVSRLSYFADVIQDCQLELSGQDPTTDSLVSSVEATTSTATTKYPASPSQYLAKVRGNVLEIL